MPTITINIAPKGTALAQGGTAVASHMWFDLNTGSDSADGSIASTNSFGWGAIRSSPRAVAGEVLTNDSQNYQHRSYAQTIDISQEQYDRIHAFARNPATYGFGHVYNALSNNCIDYTWAALRVGGLDTARFEDRAWPAAAALDVTGTIESQAGVEVDSQSNNWRDSSIDTLVTELSQHSQHLATEFWKTSIFTAIRHNFSNAWQQQWWRIDQLLAPARFDPLVLDLDGHGIATTGLSQRPVLFDHNNDGIKTGTGWIDPGEGFLVLDRNGNGVIDNGSELFGDNTPLDHRRDDDNSDDDHNAAHAFQMLAAQDSNRDGMVDADRHLFIDDVKTGRGQIDPGAVFLRRDRNANPMIENGRKLLGDTTSFEPRRNSRNDDNGGHGRNAADGFQALAAQDSNRDGMVDANDANWQQLRVWRDLNQDGVSQTEELFALEQVGVVSLAVASTSHLDTLFNDNQIVDHGHYIKADGSRGHMADINFASSPFFRQFSDSIAVNAAVAKLPDVAGSGKVRDLQQAAMQSATLSATLTNYSAATTRSEQRALLDQLLTDWADTSGMAKTLQERVGERYRIMWQTGNGNGSSSSTQGVHGIELLEKKLHIIEAFYGRHIVEVDNDTGIATASANVTVTEGRAGRPGTITIDLPARQLNFLERTYALLQESVYGALLVQTRFKSLFDTVSARVDNGHIEMDFSAIEQHFSTAVAADRNTGLEELIDFFQYTTGTIDIPQWRADLMLARQLHQLTPLEKESLVSEFGISGNRRNKAINQILTDTEQRTFRGNNSRNLIVGNARDNWIYGGGHHDLLDGSTGDDFLQGGGGDDIYLLRSGSGHDVIDNAEAAAQGSSAPQANGIDTVLFDDVRSTDIRGIRQEFDDMILQYGEQDSVTIQGGFADYLNEIDRFQFADGMVLSTEQLMTTHGIEPSYLSDADDFLSLSRFNDTLYAGTGHDVIDGEDGNDLLHGEDGNDLLFGGTGDDLLDGGIGDDLLIGDVGDDLIITGSGADVLAFNQGHGKDMVATAAGSTAAISLGFGITYADLALEKQQNDLLLHTGATSQITFENWYTDAERHGVSALQVVIADGKDYDMASTSAINNKNIVYFDFAGLVNKFDEIRAAEPEPNRWALSSALAQYCQGGSDIAALGGERAYRYARNENFLRPSSAFDPSPATLSGLNMPMSVAIGSNALTAT